MQKYWEVRVVLEQQLCALGVRNMRVNPWRESGEQGADIKGRKEILTTEFGWPLASSEYYEQFNVF